MNSGSTSHLSVLPARRILFMSDVLHTLLSFTDLREDHRFALVCHSWRDPALDRVWAELNDPICLFKLLAPMVLRPPLKRRWGTRMSAAFGNLICDFAGEIQEANWDRFQYYAKKIRSLSIPEFRTRGNRRTIIASNVFTAIARSWPSGLDCFPRLKSITYHSRHSAGHGLDVHPDSHMGELEHLYLFLNSNVEVLCVYAERPSKTAALELLQRIVMAPRLTRLEFLVHFEDPAGLAAALVQTIVQLLKLESLTVASCLFTPDLLMSVSSLPNFKQLKLRTHWNGESNPRLECRNLRSLEARAEARSLARIDLKSHMLAFPRLRDLMLQGGLDSIAEFFSRHTFRQLTSLHIDILTCNTARFVGRLIAEMPSACPCLKTLLLHRDEEVGRSSEGEELEPITVRILEPLSELANLERFELMHTQRVHITDEELVNWVSRCENLRMLSLAPEPYTLAAPTLTIDVLDAIRDVRPDMATLYLYVEIRDLFMGDKSFSYVSRWDSLQKISFGLSPISGYHIEPMELFLSKLLPKECEFTTSIGPYDPSHAQVVEVEEENRRELWETVTRMRRWKLKEEEEHGQSL